MCAFKHMCMYVCVCVCVCARARERDREKERVCVCVCELGDPYRGLLGDLQQNHIEKTSRKS